MINVFEPHITEKDIEAVNEVLRSKWLGRGKVAEELAKNFAKLIEVESEHIILTNSCTESAFLLADYLKSKGYTRAFMPSMSFVGIANAFMANGFELNFLDVAEGSANLEIENIHDVEIQGNSVLVLNHYNGCSSSLTSIVKFCEENKILLIEDSAGAMGAKIHDQSVGTFGDFGIWSVDAMKTISAGDGGLIYSKNANSAAELRERIYLGLKSESGLKSSGKHFDKWWEFDISGPFPRSITNDILAALANSQLSRIEEKLQTRLALTRTYLNELKDLKELSFFEKNSSITREASYIFPVKIESRRDALASYLRDQGIYTTFRYYPLHKISVYESDVNLPVTNSLADQILLLPLHEGLDSDQVTNICLKIKEFLN